MDAAYYILAYLIAVVVWPLVDAFCEWIND